MAGRCPTLRSREGWHIPLLMLLILLLYAAARVSADCVPAPFRVAIENVTLDNRQTARGLSLTLGTPPQPFAFLPQWPLNNTFVYGTDGRCASSMTEAGCATLRGGLYDEFGSSTRGVASADSHPVDSAPYPQCSWVTDELGMGSSVRLDNFPVGVALADWGEQGYHPQVAVGLGRNSTVLSTLKTAGQIASRSWAMFWGRTGATKETQLDGSFVFGGYDRAKAVGENFTQPLVYSNSACATGMLVTVSDITLNFDNGTDASLFSGALSDAMAACIVPDYPVLMTIPYNPFFVHFEQLTNAFSFGRSFGIYYYGMTYKRSNETYSGDLTISLSSGLSVRIPNDQLVVPNLTIDETTGAILANSTAPELVLNSIQQVNADNLPQLGRQFLSTAYLMLNEDAGQFTLWSANPTPQEDLVAVDVSNRAVDTFCATRNATSGSDIPAATTTAVTATAAATTARATTATSAATATATTGVIVGAVVGSVAGVAVAAGAVLFIWKKRQTAPGQTDSGMYAQPVLSTGYELLKRGSYYRAELPNLPSGASVVELP